MNAITPDCFGERLGHAVQLGTAVCGFFTSDKGMTSSSALPAGKAPFHLNFLQLLSWSALLSSFRATVKIFISCYSDSRNRAIFCREAHLHHLNTDVILSYASKNIFFLVSASTISITKAYFLLDRCPVSLGND